MKNHLFLFLFMAGQRVQIKATRPCSASVARFTRHRGTSPLTALVIHCKGNRRCKSPPLRTYTFTQLSPQSLDLDTRGADVMDEKGHKRSNREREDTQEGLGWLERVGEARPKRQSHFPTHPLSSRKSHWF